MNEPELGHSLSATLRILVRCPYHTAGGEPSNPCVCAKSRVNPSSILMAGVGTCTAAAMARGAVSSASSSIARRDPATDGSRTNNSDLHDVAPCPLPATLGVTAIGAEALECAPNLRKVRRAHAATERRDSRSARQRTPTLSSALTTVSHRRARAQARGRPATARLGC